MCPHKSSIQYRHHTVTCLCVRTTSGCAGKQCVGGVGGAKFDCEQERAALRLALALCIPEAMAPHQSHCRAPLRATGAWSSGRSQLIAPVHLKFKCFLVTHKSAAGRPRMSARSKGGAKSLPILAPGAEVLTSSHDSVCSVEEKVAAPTMQLLCGHL